MENDQARFFDERTAANYDDTEREDTPATVDFLEGLANGGPALELAIGTGRVALPLVARGVRVDGIDISRPMVERLRAKPRGDQISVTIGDFADVDVPGEYQLIYVVWNSFCNLGNQDDQVRCFDNVASHLADGGSFVIEAFVPDPDWLREAQYVHAEAVDADFVTLDAVRIDALEQRLDENHVVLSEEGVKLYPVVTRYVWPSELDLMARLAGLQLEERWAGWSRVPFTSTAGSYVSVYGR